MTPRFAIIGTGRMAGTMMETMTRAGVEVVAVASRERSRAERFALRNSSIRTVGDWQHVVGLAEVDAVYVATHPAHHAQIVIAALENGKAVLCEKPLASDLLSATRIIQTAHRTGILCMEALWTAFLPSHRKFFEILDTGACGVPKHLTASFGYPEGEENRCRSVEAGGLLLDRAVYLAAFALKALGPVEKVTAELDTGDDGLAVTASLTTLHKNGAQAQLAASFLIELANTAVLSGTEGSLTLNRPLLGSEGLTWRRTPPADAPPADGKQGQVLDRLRQMPLARRLKRHLDNRVHHCPYDADRYRPQLDHFVNLYQDGKAESLILPLSLSLQTAALLDQANKALTASQREKVMA